MYSELFEKNKRVFISGASMEEKKSLLVGNEHDNILKDIDCLEFYSKPDESGESDESDGKIYYRLYGSGAYVYMFTDPVNEFILNKSLVQFIDDLDRINQKKFYLSMELFKDSMHMLNVPIFKQSELGEQLINAFNEKFDKVFIIEPYDGSVEEDDIKNIKDFYTKLEDIILTTNTVGEEKEMTDIFWHNFTHEYVIRSLTGPIDQELYLVRKLNEAKIKPDEWFKLTSGGFDTSKSNFHKLEERLDKKVIVGSLFDNAEFVVNSSGDKYCEVIPREILSYITDYKKNARMQGYKIKSPYVSILDYLEFEKVEPRIRHIGNCTGVCYLIDQLISTGLETGHLKYLIEIEINKYPGISYMILDIPNYFIGEEVPREKDE